MNEFELLVSRAKVADKALMLVFSGSDWCSWCMKLDSEVLSVPEFKEWAEKNVLLCTIDFPEYHTQDAETKKRNHELAEKFGVNAFPTVILVSTDGTEIARTGYQRGGASAYINMLKELLKH